MEGTSRRLKIPTLKSQLVKLDGWSFPLSFHDGGTSRALRILCVSSVCAQSCAMDG